jgi:hypothetical protein
MRCVTLMAIDRPSLRQDQANHDVCVVNNRREFNDNITLCTDKLTYEIFVEFLPSVGKTCSSIWLNT